MVPILTYLPYWLSWVMEFGWLPKTVRALVGSPIPLGLKQLKSQQRVRIGFGLGFRLEFSLKLRLEFVLGFELGFGLGSWLWFWGQCCNFSRVPLFLAHS